MIISPKALETYTEVASMSRLKPNYIRCFKDDAIMLPMGSKPGFLKCTLCGLEAQRVYYDADDIRKIFDGAPDDEKDDDIDPNDGALYPNGHRAPRGRLDKSGSGSGGRGKSKPKKNSTRWYHWDRQGAE